MMLALDYTIKGKKLFPPMNSRAELFGESLFVTLLATPEKQLIFVNQHWEKLAKELKLVCPNWNEQEQKRFFSSEISKVLKTENYYRLRLNYQFIAPYWPLFISTEAMKSPQISLSWVGSVIGTTVDFNLDELPVKRVKSFVRTNDERMNFSCKIGSFGQESLYFLKTQYKDWDDFLWVNEDQSLRECSTSNIFAILKNGDWITPELKNCYAGVTRQALIEWLRKQNISVIEKTISPENLDEVDCLLFTNAIQLIGLIQWQGRFIPSQRLQKQLLELRRQFFLDMQVLTGGKL